MVHIFWKKADLRLSQGQPNVQQRKILYMGLYLLIWGEVANIRFMPECLCYIFHNMAYKIHGLLAGNVSVVSGENIKPSYGGDNEASLRKVIAPLYHVDEKESKKGRKGKAPHSSWCNYDDLNEYFWSYSLEAVSFSSALGKEHLGDVVYVELPEVGASVAQGSSFGAVESVKATSDVNSPILGEVVEVNEDLGNSPDKNTLKSPPSEAKTDPLYAMALLYIQWLRYIQWVHIWSISGWVFDESKCFCVQVYTTSAELRLGILRAAQFKTGISYSVPCSRKLNRSSLAVFSDVVSSKSVFHIY